MGNHYWNKIAISLPQKMQLFSKKKIIQKCVVKVVARPVKVVYDFLKYKAWESLPMCKSAWCQGVSMGTKLCSEAPIKDSSKCLGYQSTLDKLLILPNYKY